jgi:toxin ParE1/3/4
MSPSVIVRSEAESDISNTFRWYEEINQGLGIEFLRSVDACLTSLQRYPLAFPRIHKQIRRAFIRRFPYGLFYFVDRQRIVVLACFHFKRDPRQILTRLE